MSTRTAKAKNISLEQVMKALGDPVRMSVVRQLLAAKCHGKACGTFDYGVTKATFSHHLKILCDAGLLQTRQDGTRKLLSLKTEEIEALYPGLIPLIAASK